MRLHSWGLSLGLALLSFVGGVRAEEIQMNALAFEGDAVRVGDEIVLTPDVSWRTGAVTSSHIVCAKEYTVSFDVNVGQLNAAQNGGAGVFFYEVNAADDTWGNVVGVNVKDHARSNYFNSLELYRFSDEPSITIKTTRVPFLMGGAGYLHVVYHFDEGHSSVLMTNPLGAAYLEDQRPFIPGTAKYHKWYAWTGSAHNVHRLRNLQVDILRPDTCSGDVPTLTDEEASREVKQACPGYDGCATFEEFFGCADTALSDLRTAQKISPETADRVLAILEERYFYCNGRNDCPLLDRDEIFNEGFQAGVNSIDLEGAKRASFDSGFDAGVKSIDQEGLKAASYADGVAAGKATCSDEEAVRKSAYEDGFRAGVESIDVDALKATAFAAGAASVDQRAIYDNGFAAGRESVVCEEHRNSDSDGDSKPNDDDKGEDKVTICHFPPGNLANSATLSVAVDALTAHYGHGDYLGNCGEARPKSRENANQKNTGRVRKNPRLKNAS